MGTDQSKMDRQKAASAAMHGGSEDKGPIHANEPVPQHEAGAGYSRDTGVGAAVGPEKVGRKKP